MKKVAADVHAQVEKEEKEEDQEDEIMRVLPQGSILDEVRSVRPLPRLHNA
jgi:hypothetical protein